MEKESLKMHKQDKCMKVNFLTIKGVDKVRFNSKMDLSLMVSI